MPNATTKSELQLLQDRIEKFQREKFPAQPMSAKLRHCGHEIRELQENPDDDSEWADVFILLLGAAAQYGFTASNLISITHRKMDINEKREWHEPDKHGVCRHKK
jgi:hypothetical protein